VHPNYVEGSLQVDVEHKKLSHNILLEGLESLIREPCGCFEQTSSSTFPMVMLMQYIDNQTEKSKEILKIRANAEENVKKGIKRLLGYECKKGGFEWFGSDPGHTTLTAYGIWQFMEMNKCGNLIDNKVIDRSLNWLRKQYNNSKGEFKVNSGYDDFSRPPQFCSDIYILFILTLMDDYHINYKSIVEDKIKKYEKTNSTDDMYLNAFICLVYLGNNS
jgi:uncharacterized protein YfaS (alpha-2-macroglobulin family)